MGSDADIRAGRRLIVVVGSAVALVLCAAALIAAIAPQRVPGDDGNRPVEAQQDVVSSDGTLRFAWPRELGEAGSIEGSHPLYGTVRGAAAYGTTLDEFKNGATDGVAVLVTDPQPDEVRLAGYGTSPVVGPALYRLVCHESERGCLEFTTLPQSFNTAAAQLDSQYAAAPGDERGELRYTFSTGDADTPRYVMVLVVDPDPEHGESVLRETLASLKLG